MAAGLPRLFFLFGAAGFALWLSMSPVRAEQQAWKCVAKPIEPCAKHHGRLSSQNGIALKIWIIGTTRMVAVHGEIPEFLDKYLEMTGVNHSYIFGDFDICPLEPDVPGHIRSACVVGAERLVVQPDDTSRPAFRLLSTWPKK